MGLSCVRFFIIYSERGLDVMESLINQALAQKVWAVVGATQNKDKFGYKVYKTLKEHGYQAYPVNPFYDEIDGDKCYDNLSSLPEVPGVVSIIISPDRSEPFIREAAQIGCKFVWFQPGAERNDLVKLAQSLELKVISNACAIIEVGKG